ncbi:obg-like ATPase 1 [Aplysia californica]|uniref:Obg-like ATPase 1 n=1 Tax=Aplysia californica TaxID=6500 RepID=A0ABM0JRM1_APLCA|nr:obg-like ATPase 1 [Aplysia californica]XP_035826062.1 obg-like ATPase 1 [Aplysia californica]
MPPKKKGDDADKPPPLIGRVGTNLKIGIVGLPNVGKSTFFNCLTKSQAQAENFPFCTIDPNESRVPVPDKRWDYLVETYEPVSKVPAFLNVVDIAGLVKGAHEGKGLGNAFLSNISACDAVFHCVRAFSDDEIVHVEGDVDPSRDLEIIHDEIRLKDIEYLNKHLEPLERSVTRGGGDKKKKEEHEVLKKVHELLENKKWVRQSAWDAKEIEYLNQHLFLTSKPVIYLVNLSEKDYIRRKNKWLLKIKEWIDANDPGATVILFSGALEQDLLDLETQEERDNLLKEKGTVSALEKIVVTGYKALGLSYFFTAGKDEVKAWTIQNGTKAPGAAGRIHTDFEKGFIMAEVMAYDDFFEHKTENEVKAHGKYKQKGRDYVVNDGDIIFFKFNAGAGLTGKKK